MKPLTSPLAYAFQRAWLIRSAKALEASSAKTAGAFERLSLTLAEILDIISGAGRP